MCKTIKAIVTDIEGTTTALDFVHKVLFPYARQALLGFVRDHQNEAAVVAVLAQVPGEGVEAKIHQLLAWIDEDRKITPLKTLQGFVWRQGYERGDFRGHVYADAFAQLQAWYAAGIALYVFSSGSVEAQQLLFRHSDFGDMTPLFSGYFDTTLGPKREASSYQQMAQQMGQLPEQILFLSDIVEELDAAQQAGWQTICLARGQSIPLTSHLVVRDFTEIKDV
jgi:enolase-phosphatase E1